MDENRGPQLAAVLGVFLALTWLFTSLRVYVRLFLSKNWGPDDYFLLAALASFTLYSAVALAGIPYGTGQHMSEIIKVNPLGISIAMKCWFIGEILYTTTTFLLRCSVALFLLRVCEQRAQRWVIYGTMIAVGAFSVFYLFLAIFQCNPISYFWLQSIPGAKGTCIAPWIFPAATYAHSGISAATDWILGLLPIWVIWDLKMNLRTKISVAVVLSFGFIAGVAAICRVPTVRVLALNDDFLFATVDVAILSTVEPGLGIMAAAACALRPLFKQFYHLSGYGTNRSNQPSTHPSAWRSSRLQYVQRSAARSEDISLEQGAVEMGVGGSAIDSNKTFASCTQRTASFSSDEALEGIQVQKTVDVQSHVRSTGDAAIINDGRDPIPRWPQGYSGA